MTSYLINFILYLMDDKRKKSLSVRSEFLQELRDVSMRMIEAAYFIFFLPLSAIENTEITSLLIVTSYTSLFSLINLCYFAFFYMVKSKSERWRTDIAFKGYWVEVNVSKTEYAFA